MKGSEEERLYPTTWNVFGIEAQWIFSSKIFLNTTTVTSKLTRGQAYLFFQEESVL